MAPGARSSAPGWLLKISSWLSTCLGTTKRLPVLPCLVPLGYTSVILLGAHCCRGRGRSGGSSGGLGGGSGAGETELQLQRRRIDARRRALRLKLGEVQRTRAVQRAGRRRSGKPLVAVVVRGGPLHIGAYLLRT